MYIQRHVNYLHQINIKTILIFSKTPVQRKREGFFESFQAMYYIKYHKIKTQTVRHSRARIRVDEIVTMKFEKGNPSQ